MTSAAQAPSSSLDEPDQSVESDQSDRSGPSGRAGRAGRADRTRRPRRLTGGERRRQLFDVAMRLFAERGFEATTMDEIAEAAGVTKPLLYQHFSSKRALYLELVDSVAEELLSEIGAATAAAAGPREQVEDGFAAYFRMLVTHATAFRLLYGRSSPIDAELSSALRRVEDAIAVAIDPLIAAGLDPDHRRFLAYAVVGMAEGASRHWIETDGMGAGATPDGRWLDEESQRLARRLADLAWAGLRAVHAD